MYSNTAPCASVPASLDADTVTHDAMLLLQRQLLLVLTAVCVLQAHIQLSAIVLVLDGVRGYSHVRHPIPVR